MSICYDNLFNLMKERNITNEDLMEIAGISEDVIKEIMTGEYISLDSAESICVSLGVTLNDIFEFIYSEDEKKF